MPWAANVTACWDDPHWRSTVVAGTCSGNPAASTALRVMLSDCSPTCETAPPMTSSTMRRVDARALDEALQHGGLEVDRVRPGQGPVRLAPPDRGADGIDDHGSASWLFHLRFRGAGRSPHFRCMMELYGDQLCDATVLSYDRRRETGQLRRHAVLHRPGPRGRRRVVDAADRARRLARPAALRGDPGRPRHLAATSSPTGSTSWSTTRSSTAPTSPRPAPATTTG